MYFISLLLLLTFLQSKTIEFSEFGVGTISKYERVIEAEKRAIDDALSKAMEKSGIEVYYGFQEVLSSHGTEAHNFISSYLNVWSHGIVDFRVVDKSFTISETGGVKCKVKLKGKIFLKGRPDPKFEIRLDLKGENLGLNKSIYKEGDELEINFWTTRDAYIHLLAIDEDLNVTLLYPNKFTKSNFLKAGEVFNFPKSLPESKSLVLKTFLPKGKKEAVELIHIIATKKEPLFIPQETQAKEVGQYEVYSLGRLSDISKRLARLNRSDWTMKILSYKVIKK